MHDRTIEVIRLSGLTPYARAYALQRDRRDALARGEGCNTLFVLEHPPTITLGRNAKPEHLLLNREGLEREGISVCDVDRGGDITYHGPGQLVAYPILDLNGWRCSVGWYLRKLEAVLIALMESYGIQAGRESGYTGVWINGAKVAAIGVAVHRWITFHGIALNISPDMRHFQYIVPCGIHDRPVTSLRQIMVTPPPFDEAADRFAALFQREFAFPRNDE